MFLRIQSSRFRHGSVSVHQNPEYRSGFLQKEEEAHRAKEGRGPSGPQESVLVQWEGNGPWADWRGSEFHSAADNTRETPGRPLDLTETIYHTSEMETRMLLFRGC